MTDTIRLAPTQPFRFSETRWFLDRNLDDCMHTVEGNAVLKAIRTKHGPVLMRIGSDGTDVLVEQVAGPGTAIAEIPAFVEEWFDLGRELRPFYSLLGSDPALSSLAEKYFGFHLVGIPDLFECLVWCVAGQQINLSFAYTLKRRLVERFGQHLEHEGTRHYLFPDPGAILEAGPGALRAMQFTTRKAEYILSLCKAFSSGELSKERLLNCSGEEEMEQVLLGYRGIGKWTANYALMKSLGAMNRVPWGDAGLNQALWKHKKLSAKDAPLIQEMFDRFSNWKTYLVFYLWRSLREMA